MSNPNFERAWHEASKELPPADIDAAIIAAARESVSDRVEHPTRRAARVQSKSWFTQWQPLAAAAAVAGLAFVLVQTLPRERDLAPRSMPRQESAPVAAAPSAAPAQNAVTVPRATPARPSYAGEANVNDAAGRVGEIDAERRKAVAPQVASRADAASAAAASFPARDIGLAEQAPLDAQAWAAKIVALHKSGNVPAAEQALRAFRAAEPAADTYLPDSLRDWAGTVH